MQPREYGINIDQYWSALDQCCINIGSILDQYSWRLTQHWTWIDQCWSMLEQHESTLINVGIILDLYVWLTKNMGSILINTGRHWINAASRARPSCLSGHWLAMLARLAWLAGRSGRPAWAPGLFKEKSKMSKCQQWPPQAAIVDTLTCLTFLRIN